MPPRKKASSPVKVVLPEPPVPTVSSRGRRGALKNTSETEDFRPHFEVGASDPSRAEAPASKRGRKSAVPEVSPVAAEPKFIAEYSTEATEIPAVLTKRKRKSTPEKIPEITEPVKSISLSQTARVEISLVSRSVPKSSTIQDLSQDKLTEIAASNWAHGNSKSCDLSLIDEIFYSDLSTGHVSKVLDYSGYLENYLWVHYSPSASFEYIMSVIIMINEKFKETMDAYGFLTSNDTKFVTFFKDLVSLAFSDSLISSKQYMAIYVHFLTNVYRSLDNSLVRNCALKYVSLPIWEALPTLKINELLEAHPELERLWQNYVSQKSSKKVEIHVATWIPTLLERFLDTVEKEPFYEDTITDSDIYYVEKFVEFLIDLLSQRSTRMVLTALIENLHIIVRCRRSSLARSARGKLFTQLLDILDSFIHFDIDFFNSEALTSFDNFLLSDKSHGHSAYRSKEALLNAAEEKQGFFSRLSWSKLHKLQILAYNNHRDSLKELTFSSTGSLGNPGELSKHLEFLSINELYALAVEAGIASDRDAERLGGLSDDNIDLQEYLLDIFIDHYKHRKTLHESYKDSALFPNEKILWQNDIIPRGNSFDGSSVLALPKLNLQYLTLHDCFYRNFTLFMLESAYEIKEDVAAAIKRMGPRESLAGSVSFAGFSRMAVPVQGVNVTDVAKPSLGSNYPSHVYCSVEIDLSKFTGAISSEWENLKDRDVVYLICIEKPTSDATKVLDNFERERRLLSQGMKPRNNRDFLCEEETLDFPLIYGNAFLLSLYLYYYITFIGQDFYLSNCCHFT